MPAESPARSSLGEWSDAAPLRGRARRQEPGVPADARPVVAARRARHSRSSPRSSSAPDCSRTRSSASRARTGRRRRPRCSARCSTRRGWPPRSRGTSAGRSRASSGRRRRCLGRLRALVLPARGRRHAATADRRAAQPRARPHRPPRLVRGVRDAKLRIFENQVRDDVAVVPRGFGPVPGAARRDRVRRRRRAAGRAADPRRAQPRERRRRDGRGARRRCSGRRDRRGAAHVPRASSTGSRSSRRSPACATSTTRRRPTSPRRCARSRRSPARGSS